MQEVGEVATLLGDIQILSVSSCVTGLPPALRAVAASIFSSSTSLGFEETGNVFDNSGAGYMIARRTLTKSVFTFTDSTRVSFATYDLLFSPDYGNAVVVGGPAANPTTAFFESYGFTPLTASVSGGNMLFNQFGRPVFTASLASLSSTNDYFLIEASTESNDGGTHTLVLIYGINAPGTLASGVYFDANFASFNASNYPAQAYIVHWQ